MPGQKITYREVQDKIVICKDGVYLALSYEQVSEMLGLLTEIERSHQTHRKNNPKCS